jgi:predicted lipoprotein with Yx(FWY)xxD motif
LSRTEPTPKADQEETVRNPLALGAAAIITAALLAGCGSSSKSGTSSAASAPSTAAQSTPAPAATTATTTATATGVAVTTKHTKLGTILAAGPKKRTVYLFEADKGSSSTCTAACAAAWPPVTTSAAPQATGSTVTADLSTISRPGGVKQVTYKGHPLYFFEKDEDRGDMYGQGSNAFGAGWYVMKPSGAKIDDDGDSAKGGDDS